MPDKQQFACEAKLRYRQQKAKCQVICNSAKKDELEIKFLKPQFAPAPGQFAVLYDGDIVIGGGEIQ